MKSLEGRGQKRTNNLTTIQRSRHSTSISMIIQTLYYELPFTCN